MEHKIKYDVRRDDYLGYVITFNWTDPQTKSPQRVQYASSVALENKEIDRLLEGAEILLTASKLHGSQRAGDYIIYGMNQVRHLALKGARKP